MSPRRPSVPVDEDRARLLSALLDGELDRREAELARALVAEDPQAQEWLAAIAALGALARETWEEPGALQDRVAALAAEPGPAYSISNVRANGVPFPARRSRDDSSDT